MNLPKKCGDVYIKFDENNNPEYGFKITENYRNQKYIENFIKMTDKNIDTIILPKLFDKGESIEAEKISSEDWSNKYYLFFEEYVTGEVRLRPDAFKGIKNAKIVVPFTSSIMIDYGSFDKDANIEFITSPNLRLKQVYRCFDTAFDYEHENWTLIADKSFNFDGRICGDDYTIKDYNEENVNYKAANIKLTNINTSKENEEGKTL